MSPDAGPLPYTDNKPAGAPDFYFAINATFRFVHERFGESGLREYWTDLGTRYFSPVTERWRRGGLPAVAAYWRAFFDAEPGADVAVHRSPDCVTLDVRVCPAIAHLRAHRREIFPAFCQHCHFVGEAMAAPAGLTVRVEGGGGSCRQTFLRRAPDHSCGIVTALPKRALEWDSHTAASERASGTCALRNSPAASNPIAGSVSKDHPRLPRLPKFQVSSRQPAGLSEARQVAREAAC